MSVEENEAVIRKVYAEFNKGNYDVIDECYTDNFVNYRASGNTQDREGFKQFFLMMKDGFPDMQRTIQDLIVTEDRAALFFTWTGTDQWEYQGRTPTGKEITVREIYFIRFDNGKISEYRQYGDAYGMMFQLGRLVDIERPANEGE
ncbi:ester cyclase [Chloroflexota bacterium]